MYLPLSIRVSAFSYFLLGKKYEVQKTKYNMHTTNNVIRLVVTHKIRFFRLICFLYHTNTTLLVLILFPYFPYHKLVSNRAVKLQAEGNFSCFCRFVFLP